MSDTGVRLSGTNLERAADHNQRTVLQAIRIHRTITRAALAKISGLTAPAVANIVKRLDAEGLVIETGRLRQGRGQPGKVIAINRDACFSFGINVDRDHISFVLVNFLGEVIASQHWEQVFMLPDAVARLWREYAPKMLRKSATPLTRLCGIGVGIPDDLGTVQIPGASSGYSRWNEVDVAQLFAAPFDVPVMVENDATAAALGEIQLGSGSRYASVLYLLVSSGLGGAVIADGHIVRGANGRGGEIGLIPINETQLVQDKVSLAALSQCLASEGKTLADVFAPALDDSCQRAVTAWIDEAVATLTGPLVTAAYLCDPSAILIGSRLPRPIIAQLSSAIEAAMAGRFPTFPFRATIEPAALSAQASAVGAAMLPFIKLYLPTGTALWKHE